MVKPTQDTQISVSQPPLGPAKSSCSLEEGLGISLEEELHVHDDEIASFSDKLLDKSKGDVIHDTAISKLTQAYASPTVTSWEAAKTKAFHYLDRFQTKRNPYRKYALNKFKDIKQLLKNNRKWAQLMTKTKPEFFTNLTLVQSPQVLWIGCSDSRVPANQIIGLAPGEVFEHRNVSNIIHHTDLNCLSVVQYAIDILRIKHIIVCGHYGCGGVLASMTDRQYGVIDNWLKTLKDIHRDNKEEVDNVNDWKEKANLLCELNVRKSVENLVSSSILQSAWTRGQEVSVYGWCYRLNDGIIKDLGIHHDSFGSNMQDDPQNCTNM